MIQVEPVANAAGSIFLEIYVYTRRIQAGMTMSEMVETAINEVYGEH